MVDAVMEADWPSTVGICCCCLSEGEYKDMMKEYEWTGEKEVYADMLQQCFDLSMMTIPGEDSSRLICELCVTRLRDANRFRLQVEHAQINYVDRISTFRISQEKNSTELKVEFDWQAQVDDSDDNYFDDPNFSHFKKTPDDDDDEEFKIEDVKKKARAPKRKCTKSRAKVAELSEDDIKAESGQLLRIQEVFNWTRRDVLNKDEIAVEVRDKVSSIFNSTEILSSNKFLKEPINKDILLLLAYTNLYPFEWARCTYFCIFCNEKHRFITGLRSHVRTHSIQHVQKFNFSKAVSKGRIKFDTSTIVCQLCEFTFSSLKDVVDHLETAHGESIITDFVTDNVMQYNMDAMSCQTCGEAFPNFMVLNEHMNIHCKNFVCSTCGKAFATKSRHKYHQHSHNFGHFPCKKCDRVFDLRPKLNVHIVKEHRGFSMYGCPHCGERFRHNHSRLHHMADKHGEENRYKCKLCPDTFVTNSFLTVHIRRKHSNQRFKCEFCDAEFYHKHEWKNHNVKHTGERNFACTVCGKTFGRRQTLREHMKIHNNDKRFVCPVCGRAFTQNQSLKGHLKTHKSDVQE